MAQSQQFCLRWNNHRTNLVSVFDELLQNEAFTDVTLACDGGSPIKAHRMVLAACSPYFQNLFTDLPCKHPVVVLKDVKYSEIKAILEYMYRGEVNVAQDQLAALLKVAEALKVKGLVEENRACKTELDDTPPLDHSPSISTSNQVHCSSTNSSPSHSNSSLYKNPYSPCNDRKSMEARMNLPAMWALPTIPLPPHTAAGPTQTHPHPAIAMHSAAYESAGSDMSFKRKKLSGMMPLQRDTPILRTVLGQGQVDSTQPVSLVCHPDSAEMPERDERIKHMKNEPSEDAQSPYTDFTERVTDEEEKSKLAIPSSSPQSFGQDMRPGIATYVPSQKPEWKRYKQYTRDDIMSAIAAVKNGMSALQAARKYGVPSRTLYDKVKKMGITTNRPFKRSNGNSAAFPYSSGSPYGSHLSESEEIINNNSSLMESSAFLQRVLDSRGGEDQEALTAMAITAARAIHTMPMARQYSRLTPSPITHNGDQTNGSSEREREEDEDQVEDLSVHRKHEPMEVESRVIMPPMNQVSAIMKMKEVEGISKEDGRREMRVEGGAD
ncbi:nucleus accumbens-associated protein 2-like [Anthonomus grandis grandis]|uniref:nucleus accumbens-associated protein 2-like n=1 Tax=Anthonomus grandis grandis TaxID=2921223 RepID=UPI0021652364|nr:nucleus accumbens-associated protein 2-like [Anthonomus grandis grandis]XP_050303291.1 nucleus accumbens-associated protein 2-like [Anthonomus grandis grandis]XP_050303292.1 nucleus accumbens-associated protein 2-like [Anthonomus grandis grandis]